MKNLEVMKQDALISEFTPLEALQQFSGKRLDEYIKALPEHEPIHVYSPEDFEIRYQGRIAQIKKGFHPYNKMFALWLLNKFGPDTPYGKVVVSDPDDPTKVVERPNVLDYDPTAKPEEVEPKPEPKRRTRK